MGSAPSSGGDQGYHADDQQGTSRQRPPLRIRPNAFEADLLQNQGARMDSMRCAKKREDLLHMALGVFTGAGIVDLKLPAQGAITSVSDLLLLSLDELEAIADEKGGILALLDAKWRKVYKTASPRGLFTTGEIRVA